MRTALAALLVLDALAAPLAWRALRPTPAAADPPPPAAHAAGGRAHEARGVDSHHTRQ